MMVNHYSEEDSSLKDTQARILIEEHVIEGSKINQTLDEFGISKGQLVYIEFFNKQQNKWPTDLIKNQLISNPLSEQFGRSQGL